MTVNMYIRNLIIIISKILIISKNISILNLEYSLQVLLNYNYTIASIVCCSRTSGMVGFRRSFPRNNDKVVVIPNFVCGHSGSDIFAKIVTCNPVKFSSEEIRNFIMKNIWCFGEAQTNYFIKKRNR